MYTPMPLVSGSLHYKLKPQYENPTGTHLYLGDRGQMSANITIMKDTHHASHFRPTQRNRTVADSTRMPQAPQQHSHADNAENRHVLLLQSSHSPAPHPLWLESFLLATATYHIS